MLFSREGILSLLISIPGLLLAITFHEFAHGYAAYLMGDRTAKFDGRLSLNPLRHLDPVGALCMLIFRFGWAKPVPINPYNFKKQRLGVVTVSLAGPFANFILGLISYIVCVCMEVFIPSANINEALIFVYNIFYASIYMNAGLMIFNLIPIPPLDGSKVLMEFLPYRAKYKMYQYERYFGIILLLVVYLGTLTPILSTLQGYVLSLYEFVSLKLVMLFI
ncbi:MAG: site-2 protease family protein [Clostridia bacterium]|nr:site-2 protease family protein [Clostridia bacterium]